MLDEIRVGDVLNDVGYGDEVILVITVAPSYFVAVSEHTEFRLPQRRYKEYWARCGERIA